MIQCANKPWTHMAAGVHSTTYSIEFPRPHNNEPTRRYKLQRLDWLHRTNRAVIVSTDERACCVWSAVRVTTRGHAVKKEQVHSTQRQYKPLKR